MFSCLCRRRKKKCQVGVEPGDKQSTSPQKSVNVAVDQKQKTLVPNTPATSATTVSVPAEAPKEKTKKTSWWRKLLCCKKKTKPQTVKEDAAKDTNLPSSTSENSVDTVKESEGGDAGVQEAPPAPVPQVSAATVPQPEKDDVSTNVNINKSDDGGAHVQEASQEKLRSVSPVEGAETSFPSEIPLSLPTDRPLSRQSRQSIPAGHGGSLQVEPDNIGLLASVDQLLSASASTETLSREELVCLGLPNLSQTCYMNSTLQGLLTLTPFIQEVYNQQQVWSSHPSSQILREFVDIAVCRFCNNKAEKKSVLAAFKETVAEFNSEFDDNSQKDAHEFLSCVLDMLRSLYIDLHTAAVEMGLSYTCPVNAHIAFQMLSTRTCKGCGMRSIRQEDNMNLFLDLVPGGSVSQSLQDYLKESSLEYRCECGAAESSHQHSFLTLPNVLILQLQRFRFTSSFDLKKVNRPIVLSRELVVNPELGINEQTRYSLVSIISHLGSTAHSGHYICDGSYRPQKPGDVTDRWLTYNDNDISETTGESVCRHRQRTAYLLFYEKQ